MKRDTFVAVFLAACVAIAAIAFVLHRLP